MRSGTVRGRRTGRKQFLETAAAIAVGVPSLTKAIVPDKARLLRERRPITVTIYRTSPPGHDWMQDLINGFQRQNPTIAVTSVLAPQSAAQIVAQLSGGSSAIDLYQIDVIWPPELAAAGWILPLDAYLPDTFKNDLLAGPKQSATIAGRLYAIPQVTDVGVLVYRSDLLSNYKLATPQTWTDLVRVAQTVVSHERGVPDGMLWQGARYEGLFCDICELFWSNGGNVLQHATGPPVVLDTPNNRAALQFMVDTIWRYKIAPLAVTTYMEEDTILRWSEGKAVFMRSWLDMPAVGSLPDRAMAHKIGIARLPHGPLGRAAGCLGGWSLAINARSANPTAAARLALHLTSAASQRYLAINAGFPPTLISLYSDPEILASNPAFRSIFQLIASARLRPVTKDEGRISDRVARWARAALFKQIDVPTALQSAQRDVAQIVNGSTP